VVARRPRGAEPGELESLLKRLEPALRRVGQRYRLDADDFGDLVQETCVHFLLARDGIADPEAWFLVVFRRCAYRLRREQLRRARMIDEVRAAAPTPGPDPEMARRVLLREAFRRLPMRLRAALVLHYFVGLSLEQIAARLGYRESSMKRVLNRTLRRLRAVLDVT
jgi:RNA polymerase sigma factor (sigma-70 family)